MIIKKDMFLSKVTSKSNQDGSKYFIVDFLDENDDKYSLFYSEDQVKPLLNLKHLDKVSVDLSITRSDKGKYTIYKA